MNQKASEQARRHWSKSDVRLQNAMDAYMFAASENVVREEMLKDYPNRKQDEQYLIELRIDSKRFTRKGKEAEEELRCACRQYFAATRRFDLSCEREPTKERRLR